jgi:ABC-type uncharacterized transport system, permease component
MRHNQANQWWFPYPEYRFSYFREDGFLSQEYSSSPLGDHAEAARSPRGDECTSSDIILGIKCRDSRIGGKLYMSTFKIAFKTSFVYRSSALFRVIGSVFRIFVSIALWKYVYQKDSSLVSYMIVYTILSNLIGMFYSNQLSNEISSKVSDGTFCMELIKPVNFIYLGYQKMLGEIFANLLTRGLPVILIFLPLLITRLDSIHIDQLLFFCIAVVFGHVLYTIMYALIGFIAFICYEIWPFNRLLSDTIRFLSGSFIPIALFPTHLKALIDYLPFKYLYSFPLRLCLETVPQIDIYKDIAILFVWIIVLFSILVFAYNHAVNKLVVQGG